MTEQTKRFCPKCKNELHSDNAGSLCCKYPGMPPFYFPTYLCLHCKRPSFEIDCLTEEQLEPGLVSKKDCGCATYKHKFTVCDKHMKEIEKEISKQPPSFCFAESQDKLSKLSPDSITLVTSDKSVINDDWINFSDRKPEIGQEIVGKSVMTDSIYRGKYCKNIFGNPYLSIPNIKGRWAFDVWKPAQADKDVAQPVEKRIRDAIPMLKAQEGHKENIVNEILEISKSIETKECEHDYTLKCKECGMSYEKCWCDEDGSYPCQVNGHEYSYYCVNCGHDSKKDPSQIAIDKVIEALKPKKWKVTYNKEGFLSLPEFESYIEEVIKKLKEPNK